MTYLRLSVLSLFLFTISSAYSQTSIAIKAGLNSSSIASDFSLDPDLGGEPETKSKPGYHFGLVVDFELSEKFVLQSGLLFNSKGYSFDEDFQDDDFDKVSINYLEVPVNAKFNLSDNFFGLFGPYVALGVGGSNSYEFSGNSSKDKVSFISKEISFAEIDNNDGPSVRRLDLGLNIGLGYSFEPISITVNYGLGLTNLNPTVTDFPTIGTVNADDIKQCNRVFSLSISYNILN